MHNAPSVSLPVGRSFWALALGLMAWLAGGAALALWWASSDVSALRLAVLATVLGVSGGVAGCAWWTAPQGRLLWHGGWWWEAAAQQRGPGSPAALPLDPPAVVLDFQSVLLLRLRPGPAGTAPGMRCPAALWLERRSAAPGPAGDEHWRSLRRAVYSRAVQAAQPPGTAIP